MLLKENWPWRCSGILLNEYSSPLEYTNCQIYAKIEKNQFYNFSLTKTRRNVYHEQSNNRQNNNIVGLFHSITDRETEKPAVADQ